jgi:hypothetical protein
MRNHGLARQEFGIETGLGIQVFSGSKQAAERRNLTRTKRITGHI